MASSYLCYVSSLGKLLCMDIKISGLRDQAHVGKKDLKVLNVSALTILGLENGIETCLHAGRVVVEVLQLNTIS